jgi:hypothetical protein
VSEHGGGDARGSGADLASLPQEIAAQSLSKTSVILPYDAALQAITLLTGRGRRLENWEGWVKMRDGGRARSLAHSGSFALSADPARAAETAAAGITRAHARWQRDPEYPGAALYFGLTFGAA